MIRYQSGLDPSHHILCLLCPRYLQVGRIQDLRRGLRVTTQEENMSGHRRHRLIIRGQERGGIVIRFLAIVILQIHLAEDNHLARVNGHVTETHGEGVKNLAQKYVADLEKPPRRAAEGIGPVVSTWIKTELRKRDDQLHQTRIGHVILWRETLEKLLSAGQTILTIFPIMVIAERLPMHHEGSGVLALTASVSH